MRFYIDNRLGSIPGGGGRGSSEEGRGQKDEGI